VLYPQHKKTDGKLEVITVVLLKT